MRLQILFCVLFAFLLHMYTNSSQGPIYTEKSAVATTVPTSVATQIVIPPQKPTRATEPTNTPNTSIFPSIIDTSSVLNNAIATIFTTILISLTGWLTHRFWISLILHRQLSPLQDRRKRRNLARYLQQERVKILEVLAPGSIDLQVKDIVGDRGLFIPPPWRNLYSTTSPKELVEYLTTTLLANQRVLLLGDAGQGKTIVLKQVFSIMVNHFLENSKHPFPLYIPLREFTYSTGDALDSLWAYLRHRFPLSFEDFTYLVQNNQVAFLYDGFDEIKGELTQHSINDRASSNMFSHPSILSCRSHFYNLYLSMSPIKECYPTKIGLQPLTLSNVVKNYIIAFCNIKQEIVHYGITTSPREIVDKIQANPGLLDLIKRPLLLVMILDIFTDPKEMSDGEWNMAKLYQKYTEKWLQNEAAKPDSILRQDEKASLMQEIAWSTHRKRAANPYRMYQAATFTREEVAKILKCWPAFYQEQNLKYAQLTDDICFRTFLIATEGVSYYFIHKSFQEYYVARYIYDALRIRGRDLDYVAQTLQELIPIEVEVFLRAILRTKELSRYDKEQMTNTLIKVYQQNKMNDDQAAIIRQYASYYLTVLDTQKAIQFLEQSYQQEANKWVKRGMMVGLALNCKRADILEEYINIVNTDPEAASINIGYHLVHFGDQSLEDGYHDKGNGHCAGTLRAIFDHLRSEDEDYRNCWVLDLLTLRMLLERRGDTLLYADEEYLPFLQAFLSATYREQGKTFQQEKRLLQKLVKRTTRKLTRQNR